ncbi:MAG TPA: MFS transporter [Micropepsaceae bacterium]|nr:MFS transporter [Micropepsaceae bacterium]
MSPATSERVFTKVAWRLVPFMALLYLISIIDRLNVGFAALTMNEDLSFSPTVFGWGAGIFFVGYSLFQVPANFFLERVGPRRWVFLILICWGAVSAACAFVQGPMSFYGLRFVLGLAEAGLFPGIVLYLTYWFPQSYHARLTASFMAASPFAFIIGGPLASFLLQMDGILGLHGWQWLFLIEAAPAIVLAFVLLRIVPNGPEEADWLNREEKALLAARLAEENLPREREFWPALLDSRVLILGLAYVAIGAGGYGIRIWLPQIVQDMGFSTFNTGFVAAVLYAAAMLTMILWGQSSDRRGERVWHVAIPTLLSAAGFVVAAIAGSDMLVLFALGAVVIGLDAVIGPFWSLPSAFLRGSAAAGGIALINTFGTGLGGFLGSVTIGYLKDVTGTYAASMAVLAGALVFASILVLTLVRAIAPRVERAPAE